MKNEWIDLLAKAVDGGQAHIDFEAAVKGIPFEYCGKKVKELPYTLWQLVEHLRLAQKDILDFSVNPDYQTPSWPKDYWPEEKGPKNKDQWEQSLQEIKKDREAFIELLKDPSNDLLEPFPHGEGQNLFREALLIVDHNSYHTGQIIILRRLMGIYK